MAFSTITLLNYYPTTWQEAAHDVAAGLRVGIGHAIHHGAEFITDTLIKPIAHSFGITFEGENPEPSDGIKVVGVGYGRTGKVCIESVLCVDTIKICNENLSLIISKCPPPSLSYTVLDNTYFGRTWISHLAHAAHV